MFKLEMTLHPAKPLPEISCRIASLWEKKKGKTNRKMEGHLGQCKGRPGIEGTEGGTCERWNKG